MSNISNEASFWVAVITGLVLCLAALSVNTENLLIATNQIEEMDAYRFVNCIHWPDYNLDGKTETSLIYETEGNLQKVDSLNKSFPSIQDAINASESGDTINVAAGIYRENINIDKSLTINGAGADITILDGHQVGSALKIGKANVTITNMNIRGGTSPKWGAGIINTGRLIVMNCSITENSAEYGGGIYNSGTLILIDSIVSENSVRSDGGGIYNKINSQLTIQGASHISKNTAQNGGGIVNHGTLKLDGSKISGNTANLTGGGIVNDATMTMAGSTVSGNSAANGWGGGIANFGMVPSDGAFVAANSVIRSSLITENHAAQFGGGIASDGTGTITGTVVSGNDAKWGGGIYSDGFTAISKSTVSGNIAGEYGGGVLNDRVMSMTDCTIIENKAKTNGGGGIANYGDMVNSAGKVDYSGVGTIYRKANLIVSGTTISNNVATDYGGGIASDSITAITDSTITGNKAPRGAGVYNDGSLKTTGNSISGNIASLLGGGIYNDDIATINDGSISGNTAKLSGGGIYNTKTLFVRGTTQITNNEATTDYGGGVYSYSGPITFAGRDVSVKANKAHLPPLESNWYQGWDVYSYNGLPTATGGFDPAKQVTRNVHI